VETPLLWKEFIWPHYDFCEESTITSVFESCGTHVKLIFSESRDTCEIVTTLRLSLPSECSPAEDHYAVYAESDIVRYFVGIKE